jgi:hypothetical protein
VLRPRRRRPGGEPATTVDEGHETALTAVS